MITRATLSTIEQGLPKYRSMLAGNPAYNPEITSGFYSLATATPTGTNSVTFSGISTFYKHLQIRCKWTDGAGGVLLMRINGDTSGNYYTGWLEGQGSSYSGSTSLGSTTFQSAFGTYGGSGNTDQFNSTIIDINNYRDTNKNKTILSQYGFLSTTNGSSGFATGLWASTSAVSSITLFSLGDNFQTGSVIALYGIGG